MAKKKKKILKPKIENNKEEDFPIHKISTKIIGIGGGAGSIINDIAGKYKRTEFYIADTDQSALINWSRKRRIKVIPFGQDITEGMGTGMDTDLARKAVQKDRDKIKEALGGADLLVFVSCLGGGTGSGALPVFAEIAKETKSITLGIFTLPFDFEREKKLQTARKSLSQLYSLLDGIAVIPNQRIFEIADERLPIKEALSNINNALGESLEGLIRMIHGSGTINIDFADLETILKVDKPLVYLSRVRESGKSRAKKALKKLINDPLYAYGFENAKGILFNIDAPNNLSLSEVAEISETISEINNNGQAKIVFGVTLARGKNELDVTLLAVGCDDLNFLPQNQSAKKKQKKGKKQREVAKKKKKKKEMEKQQTKEEKSSKKEKKQDKKKKKKSGIEQKKEPIMVKEQRVRKNALQVQEELKAIESEILEEEQKWEKPAFLRNKKWNK